METFICYLQPGTYINIDNLDFEVQEIKAIHKTKRRYECSVWYPKGAGYDTYKLNAINVFTKEPYIKIYDANTKFKLSTFTKTKYYVIEINNDVITLFTENYVEKSIKISDIDINTYIKINKYLNDKDIGEIIITILTGPNLLKIIDLQITKYIM
jgi:hypothetical protein